MRLICQACGAMASLEIWFSDAETRNALLAITRLPSEIIPHAPAYLGLFRPEKSALSWRRVVKLVEELREISTAPSIVWEHKRPLPNRPTWWLAAMEQTLAQRDKIKRPLANHNYLRTIAYAAAESAEAQTEQRQEQSARSPFNAPPPIPPTRPAPIDPERRRQIREDAIERLNASRKQGGDCQLLGVILGDVHNRKEIK